MSKHHDHGEHHDAEELEPDGLTEEEEREVGEALGDGSLEFE